MSRDDPEDLLGRLAALAPEDRREALRAAGESAAKRLDGHWRIWAHEGQLPPHDDWDIWLLQTGRGFGKTRAGAEWVSAKARAHPEARIALVAATPAEARRVMVEGRGGLFAAARDGEERRHMVWEPGLGRLTFASGAVAFTYSGANGESLRGPEHHFAWCDELAKWKRAAATWDNLLLGLRAGARPQVVVTTTPRAVAAFRALLGMDNLIVTRGASWRNPHYAPSALAMVERLHAGTRLGRQELYGELLDDVEAALFPRALLETSRAPPFPGPFPGTVTSNCPHSGPHSDPRLPLRRTVIGVDPPATAYGDACGIVACALGADGIAWVLADHSASGLSPEQWARKVAAAAEKWGADRVVAEGNQGGEMVETVLRGAGLRLPVKRVHARTGKSARAEPIAAFFESGEAKLAGRFPALEDELAGLTYGGGYEGPGRSPDRADAMVWALTELLLENPPPEPRIRRL